MRWYVDYWLFNLNIGGFDLMWVKKRRLCCIMDMLIGWNGILEYIVGMEMFFLCISIYMLIYVKKIL